MTVTTLAGALRGSLGLAFTNAVFHHILPTERAFAGRCIHRALRTSVVALWENNLWNPATRYMIRRIPFDRDAIAGGA